MSIEAAENHFRWGLQVGHAGYQGQSEIIYLRADAEEIEAAGVPFAFTDGHAIISYVNHYNQLADLTKLEWNAIRAHYWNDVVDGRCRRQAEFLIKDRIQMNHIREIGVMEESVREKVVELLKPTVFQPLINVHREWYF